ncbi:MAG: hypothetical protein ACM3X3_09065 [Betaproteobacteria bacterium]
MGDVRSLYYDTWLRASYQLLDYVVEAAEVWDALPDYRKEGKLVYFDQLVSYLAILRTGETTGKLTRAQVRKLRNLERLVKQAEGVIKALRADYEASRARGGDDGS